MRDDARLHAAALMEKRVKERLTGALVLVAAIVILVPEMFGGRGARAPGPEESAAAKAGDGPPLRSYTIEMQPQPGATPAVPRVEQETPAGPGALPPASLPPASPPAASGAPAAPAAPAQRDTSPPAVSQPAVPPAAPPSRATSADTGAGWLVQVGSFSQRVNAERFAQELARKGYDAKVDATRGAGGRDMFRVRVGPSGSRDAAARLQSRLSSDGYKGTLAGPS